MARYGSFYTNTEHDSYFYINWNTKSQDIATNKSVIEWSANVHCGHNFYSNAIRMSAFSINGIQVYGGGTYSNLDKNKENDGHLLAYGTLEIAHDADGTKKITVSSFTGWLYSNHNYYCIGGSEDLPTIPRGATIESAPDFTDLDNPTITYSNPAGNAVTALDACISFTGERDDIPYRWLWKTEDTYTFPLEDEEREILRANTPGTERDVIFYVRSKIGNTTFWSTLTRKLTIVESEATKPDVDISVTLNNSSLPGVFDGMYIQGKSKVDVWLSAIGKYSANINRFSANIDGKTYSFGVFGPQDGITYYTNTITSDAIQSAGRVDIIGYARDTRGFTGSIKESINVTEYSKPLVVPLGNENAIQCYRSDRYGKRVGNSTLLWIKAKRSYYSLEGKNTCALQWRMKPASDAWVDDDEWEDLIAETDDPMYEYNGLLPDVEFDLHEAYTVQIRAIDTIGEQDIKTFEVPTQDVALHLGRGGKNVAVGTYCDYSEDYTFYSGWKAIFDKEVIIGGAEINDFVVEEGTIDDWLFRKWNSGNLDCWGTFIENNVEIKTPWGILYESKGFQYKLPNNLFTETPLFHILLDGNGGCMLETYGLGSNTESPLFAAVRPNEGGIVELHVHIMARGKWK